jgi:hypothetical protein
VIKSVVRKRLVETVIDLRTLVCVTDMQICNYESCVNIVNESKILSKTPSIITPKLWQYHPTVRHSVPAYIALKIRQVSHGGKIYLEF